MSQVFTAPVLLGVSGASLMIAAAIVAVAITWTTAAPVVRGLLVLVVAGAVGALAVWLRRLHLVITSGSVGIVAMGFAGTSAVAFLSESPTLAVYSTAVAFLIAGVAGIALVRLKLAWVGPAAAVALGGFAVAFTITVATQTADAWAIWAWSLTGVATAFGLAATYALWPWKSAQHIVVWGGLGWVCATGAFAALWLWFGDVTVAGSGAALVPIAALVWLSRRWRPVPVVVAAVLITLVAPGIAFAAGAGPWLQFAVLGATLAAAVGLGARLSVAVRRPVLAGLAPAYVVAWVATVGYAVIGLMRRLEALMSTFVVQEFVFDLWVGVAALLLAVSVAALRSWKLADLKVTSGVQQLVVLSGPLAAIAAVTVLTVTASDLAAGSWAAWVWSLTGIVLALVLGLTRSVWGVQIAQRIALWTALVWIGIVGAIVAVWAWSGDLTVIGALAGLLPVAALVALVRWMPRVSVIIAAALATLVVPSIAFVAGLNVWQQTVAVAVTIAVGVASGIKASAMHRASLAIGLAPAFVVVALGTGGYAVGALVSRVFEAMTGMLEAQYYYAGTLMTVDMWAGVAALVAGLSVAGVRLWQLRESGRALTVWLRTGGVIGALMVLAGVTIVATAVADMAGRQSAHSALASALVVASVVLLLARILWSDHIVKNVSSASGVVLAGLAGVHGVWGLAVGELTVWAGLGIALAPLVVLAVWGAKRPAEGTGLAALLATATVAALASSLGASPTLALAVAVVLAAVAAWTVPRLAERQREPVLIGVSPALAWGLIAGLWSAVNAVEWMDSGRWSPHGWAAVTALTAAVGFAATRTGPWRRAAVVAEPLGALLVLAAAPVALGAGALLIELNKPAVALGSVLAGAVVAAAGLVWWRDRLARRITRIGTVLWVTGAGLMGWLNVIASSWDFATLLVLSVVALVMLVAAARWWPRVALAPTALLLTGAPFALVARAEWAETALGVALMVGTALVALLLLAVPGRVRFIGVIGMVPALAIGAVAAVVMTLTAAVEVLAGGLMATELADHWWALGLVAGAAVTAALIGRLGLHRAVAAIAHVALGAAIVGVVTVATAAFGMLAAPETPGAEGRLLLAPVVAVALSTVVVLWSARAQRLGAANGQSLASTTARWGVAAWVMALGVALQVWLFQEDINWLAGAGLVVAVTLGLGAAGTRWPYLGLVPAVALVTVLPFAVVPVTLDVPFAASACFAVVLVAGATWIARAYSGPTRTAVLAGLLPAAIGVLGPAVMALLWMFAALVEHLTQAGSVGRASAVAAPTWWHIGVIAGVAVAALAWRGVNRFRGWLLLSVVVVTASVLPAVWAVVALSATALALLFVGKWLRTGSVAAGIAVAFAMVWSIGSDPALGVTAATATVIAGTVALGWGTRARTWGAVVAPGTALIAGVFLARALDAAHVAVPAGVGLAMVAVLALVSADRDRLRTPVAYTAIVITGVAPLFADATEMTGLAYVLGAATWWRLFSAGLTWAKWMCAATASAGVAALLASIDIQIIEAYTAVPAVALLLIGVQWMSDRPQLRSVTALAPGLAAALVPSYLALVLEPDALWRTIALVGAIVVLALIGLRLRWFAPILGTAVTAVVLSVLQIIAGGNLVVRLVAFAVVGALLLGIASYFEKLKELR